jgi:hypothetical protein
LTIVNQISRKVDKKTVECMYTIGRGGPKSLEKFCEKIGLGNQKRLFGEIFGLVFGRETKFVETTFRLGVFIGNAPLVESIFTIILTVVKIKTEILAKLNFAAHHDAKLSFEDENNIDLTFNTYVEQIKKALLVLYKNDILNYRDKIFRYVYKISLFEINKGRKRQKKISMFKTEDQIECNIHNDILMIVEGKEEELIKNIFKKTSKIGIDEDKKKYIISLCGFVVGVLQNKDYDSDEQFSKQMKLAGEFLDIEETPLQLLFDIGSSDPVKIFKCNSVDPKINIGDLSTTSEFDIQRISKIADILEISKTDTKKLACGWIFNY